MRTPTRHALSAPALAVFIVLLVVGVAVAASTTYTLHLHRGDNAHLTCTSPGVLSKTDTTVRDWTVKCRNTTATATPTTATPTPTPTTATPTPTPTTATPTPTPTSPTTTPTAGDNVCQPGSEIKKWSGRGGGSSDIPGDYDASMEEWGIGGYNYTQTMGVCSHDSWYVDVTTDNSAGDGAVKAYPSVRRIYHDWSTNDFSNDPLISSFPQLSTSFHSIDPATCPSCIYDTAFDIWINGIASSGCTELMIWTHNVAQRPAGSKVLSGVQLDGHTWDVWSANAYGHSNGIVSFVVTDTPYLASGVIDVQHFTNWMVANGRLASGSRLGQISFGVEPVSTGGVSRHWDFTDFTITDS